MEKVNITACGGLNFGGTLGRRAVVEVCEKTRKDVTQLVSIGGFARALLYNDTSIVEQGLKPFKKYKTIAVNGCTLNCATDILRYLGVKPAESVQVMDIVGGTRKRISNITEGDVEKVRVKIEEAVDRILAESK
ncbi:MAG: putative zinc-binding protein [Candidatus Methanospirareceae archaeon]